MSEIEVKPCPFCGSDDIKGDVYMRDGREVVCRECKARVGEFNPNANDKAVEKWNRRASEVSNEWVKWDGGNFMPVPGEAVVTVMLRDGSIEGPARAREFAGTESCWEHRDSDGDIIAYRLAQSDYEARIRSALVERKAEPVAWQWQSSGGEWIMCEDEDAAKRKIWIGKHPIRPLYSTPPAAPVRDEAKRIVVLEKAMEALRKTAVLLLQNAQGCAVNHYHGDFEMHGLPGWLGDARTEIEAATAVLSATIEPADDREGLIAAAAKVRADYERANMKPCDCSTPDGALHYGRAQGLEMAADILSASPSPVDSRDGLIERCAQIADAAALAAAAMKDRKDAKSASGTAILTGYIFAETEAKAIAAKIRALAAKEQQP